MAEESCSVEAAARGYEVRGVETSAHAAQVANESLGHEVVTCSALEDAGLAAAEFDVCVCTDVIEHVRNPLDFLVHAHRVLKPGGVLLLVTPTIDSRMAAGSTAARTSSRWNTCTTSVARRFKMCWRVPAFADRARGQSQGCVIGLRASAFWPLSCARDQPGAGGLVPPDADGAASLSHRRLRPAASRSSAGEPVRHTLVSVIVPAYNECRTVRHVMERLLAKRLDGLDKEIIIVEGNSSDGTREAVLGYQGVPGVQIILTDQPRGKGHAVRQGLERATGDFILIQDADDEYDIDDYDALLEPLRRYHQAFVLGSRHKGHWRMRNLTERVALTAFINVGHVLLTGLFNLLYGQKLSDPWTMYKVFRRDCLHRMHLECSRFDFDVELVAKLVRRGFTPIEVPVSYRSRSFAEGKKIRVLRDPWGWIWACVKYRMASIDKQKVTGLGRPDQRTTGHLPHTKSRTPERVHIR